MKHLCKPLLLLGLVAALGACADSSPVEGTAAAASGLQPIPRSAPQCALPAEGQLFPPADPAQLGFDPARLAAALDYGTRLLSTSIRVYRYGCLAGETQQDQVSVWVPQLMASASKTILSLLSAAR